MAFVSLSMPGMALNPAPNLAMFRFRNLARSNPFVPRVTLYQLPAETRVMIFEYVFSEVEFNIHVHDEECAEYCGDRRSTYRNTALLRVSRLIHDESYPIFLSHSIFHVFKTAFHSHNGLTLPPQQAVINLRTIVCWADVAYRRLTAPVSMRMLGQMDSLKMVYFNVTWNWQHKRMSPEIRAFMNRNHPYEWMIDIKKSTRSGLEFRVCINKSKQALIVERTERYDHSKLVKILAELHILLPKSSNHINGPPN